MILEAVGVVVLGGRGKGVFGGRKPTVKIFTEFGRGDLGIFFDPESSVLTTSVYRLFAIGTSEPKFSKFGVY